MQPKSFQNSRHTSFYLKIRFQSNPNCRQIYGLLLQEFCSPISLKNFINCSYWLHPIEWCCILWQHFGAQLSHCIQVISCTSAYLRLRDPNVIKATYVRYCKKVGARIYLIVPFTTQFPRGIIYALMSFIWQLENIYWSKLVHNLLKLPCFI